MGYNLYVTRKDDTSDKNGPDISKEEWLKFVKDDPELCLAGYNGPFHAIWSVQCSYPEPWFDWHEGCIYTKNPDDAIIAKMLDIAKKLNAKVQGDDGEVYTRPSKNGYL